MGVLQDLSNKLLDDGLFQNSSLLLIILMLSRGDTRQVIINAKQIAKES